MEESEIYISEMKVLKSQMKVVPSFHHRALRRLQEVSRANSHTLPKAFRVRRRRERLRERERECVQLVSVSFYRNYNIQGPFQTWLPDCYISYCEDKQPSFV